MATEENQEVNTEVNAASTENTTNVNTPTPPSTPPVNKASNKKTTLSTRLDQNLKQKFQDEAINTGMTQEDLFARMWKAYKNPVQPKTIEIEKEVIKEVEVVKEVEKELQGNQILVNLSDKQNEYLSLIQEARLIEATKKVKAGQEDPVKESKATILKRAFFIRSRLLNLDSNFYTGVPQNALD